MAGDDSASNDDVRPDASAGKTEKSGLEGLAERDGWRVENGAARVHYSGAGDRYSIEYYPAGECTLYWSVPDSTEPVQTAVPVDRRNVPEPLRERIREDLSAAGIDPAVDEGLV